MNIVVAGGGYAGMAAALRLARRTRGAARIVLASGSATFVERIRLHQAATGQNVVGHSLAPLLERAAAELVVGHIQSIDADRQTLTVGGKPIQWDRLVLALGSQTSQPATEDIFTLDCGRVAALHKRLFDLGRAGGGRVAIVGGGLTGIEAATEIAQTWPQLDVHLITRGPIAQGWSTPARNYMLAALDRMGVTLEEGSTVEPSISGHYDLNIWTAGFAVSSLPRKAGIAVNPAGQVVVDRHLRSLSHPAIYAAGDICAPAVDPGAPLPLGCKSALPAGAYVGNHLAGEIAAGLGLAPDRAPFDFGLSFYCVSLGRHDGLVQWAARDERGMPATPTGKIMTGRPAAWFKEAVCRYTWKVLALEARGIPAVFSAGSGQAPQLLPAGSMSETEDDRAA